MRGPISRSCFTNSSIQTAPNPSPSRWDCKDYIAYPNGYVLMVKYLDCTNFEGMKIMVYKGKFKPKILLDPHFSDDPDSPIARFKPTPEGLEMAKKLAESL